MCIRCYEHKRQITKQKCAKLPNESAPNCQTKVRQIAKRKCAKLPNGNAPNCQIKSAFYFVVQINNVTLQTKNI